MAIPKLTPPTKPSTSILGIGYDQSERILYIEFKGTGVYAYNDVPPKTYEKLLAADSIGRFIAKDITPNHFYRKLKPHETSETTTTDSNTTVNHTPVEGC